jgi:hypothetical protein
MREASDLHGWHRRFALILMCMVLAAAGGGWTIWRAFQSGRLPGASCGTAITHNLGGDTQILSESDTSTLGCFAAAARRCKAASVGVTAMGVDSGVKYVFVIRSGGSPCQMTELSQSYGWTGGRLSTGPVMSVACRRTIAKAGGVMLSCARLAVLIPAAVAEPRN